MKNLYKFGFVLVILVTGSTQVQAQPRNSSRIRPPLRQPTLSPYLNLLRDEDAGGGGTGFNYFQRVQPQFDYLQTSQNLANSLQQVDRNQSLLQKEIETGRSPTGHRTSFMNYHGYFPQP